MISSIRNIVILNMIIIISVTAHPYYQDITFSTQTEIESFGLLGYTEMYGNVTINESSTGNILDLTPLSGLTYIKGNLIINENSSLKSLNGLNNITAIGGNLYIYKNNSLEFLFIANNLNGGDTSIAGNITSVDGTISIKNNVSLIDLYGLSNISSPVKNIIIMDNPWLVEIDGLINIPQVADDLQIRNNSSLIDFGGLNKITSIGGMLEISYNTMLTNINELNKLNSIGTDLIIAYNDSLSNIDGLSNLISITGNLSIYSNGSLFSLCGLSKLLTNDGLSGTFNVSRNAYNNAVTDKNDIINNCDSILINAKVYLEGPYSTINQNMYVSNNISLNSPYYIDPKNVTKIPKNVVDWILVELRSVKDKKMVIASKSAFLLSNGSIVGLDGVNPLEFYDPINLHYYLAVKHRNHFSIMSNNAVMPQNN